MHFACITEDGKMWHTIRRGPTEWQLFFGDVKGNHTNDPGIFRHVACSSFGFMDSHYCAATDAGGMWHTLRRDSGGGGWQGFFGDVKGAHTNDPGPFQDVACTTGLHVVGASFGGGVWHTIRGSERWQGFFGDVKAMTSDPGTFRRVSCANAPREITTANWSQFDVWDLHIVGVTDDGKMWHTIRYARSNRDNLPFWQRRFGDVKGAHTNDPGPFQDVACAGIGRDLHVVGVTEDGNLWHTIRFQTSWQGFFGDVKAAVGGRDPGAFVRVSCGESTVGPGGLHVCGITQDGNLWHTLRLSDRWDPFENVKRKVGHDPGRFIDVGVSEP